MKSITNERRLVRFNLLLVLSTFLILFSACQPSFKTPEQAGEAIYVSLVHDDEEYLRVVMASREDLNKLYANYDDAAADAEFSAQLDSFYQEALDALPGAMDAFRDGVTRFNLVLSDLEADCNNSHTENSALSENIDVPLKKAIVWVEDADSYESYVLVIRHLARVNGRWVIAYPEFTWMTSDEYYESDYGDDYYFDDYYEEAEAVEAVPEDDY